MSSEDTLFEAPGPARTILEQLHVVVGFQHKNMRRANPFQDELRCVAEVGQKSDVRSAGAQHESHGILGVVRNGKCLHGNVPDIERAARGEEPEIEMEIELIPNGISRGAIAVDRELKFLGEDGEAANMIAVFVRDEDAVEGFGRASDGLEAFSDLTRTEPGVDEQPGLAGFKIRAIPGGTAAQDGQMHRHG